MAKKIDFKKAGQVEKPKVIEEKIVVEESGIIQGIMDKNSPVSNGCSLESIKAPDNNFRLYSLNKARLLLGIGRSTLERYINDGLIGVIPQTKNKVKIPHSELQRFIDENINRVKKQSILTSTEKKEVTNFINGHKADVDKNFDSSELFDKLMERNNGKRVQ